MTQKQAIAALILKHSIDLLLPMANDVKGINDKEQKKIISAIANKLGDIVVMDSMLHDEEMVTVEELQEDLDDLKKFSITYTK